MAKKIQNYFELLNISSTLKKKNTSDQWTVIIRLQKKNVSLAANNLIHNI